MSICLRNLSATEAGVYHGRYDNEGEPSALVCSWTWVPPSLSLSLLHRIQLVVFPVAWWLKGWRCLSANMLVHWLAGVKHRKQCSESQERLNLLWSSRRIFVVLCSGVCGSKIDNSKPLEARLHKARVIFSGTILCPMVIKSLSYLNHEVKRGQELELDVDSFQTLPLPVTWPWPSHFFWNLGFLFCKMQGLD